MPEQTRSPATVNQALDADLAKITDDHAGYLRCETCGQVGPVRDRYWREGWPKCHGATMRWWTRRQVEVGEVPPMVEVY